jgi:hypothetical protein
LRRLLATLNEWRIQNLFQGVFRWNFHHSLFLQVLFHNCRSRGRKNFKAVVPFGSSSSLREDIWVKKNKGIEASNDYWPEKRNLRISFMEVE